MKSSRNNHLGWLDGWLAGWQADWLAGWRGLAEWPVGCIFCVRRPLTPPPPKVLKTKTKTAYPHMGISRFFVSFLFRTLGGGGGQRPPWAECRLGNPQI